MERAASRPRAREREVKSAMERCCEEVGRRK
jgi:hypothetical protein